MAPASTSPTTSTSPCCARRPTSIVDILTVTAEPSCVAVSPDSSKLYIADHAGSITVMSVAGGAAALETELTTMNVPTVPELRGLQAAAV